MWRLVPGQRGKLLKHGTISLPGYHLSHLCSVCWLCSKTVRKKEKFSLKIALNSDKSEQKKASTAQTLMLQQCAYFTTAAQLLLSVFVMQVQV